MTRLAVIAATLGLAAVASADRVITAPTARKIPVGTVRYEYRGLPNDSSVHENLIGFGLTTLFEMEVRSSAMRTSNERGTFDLAYNVIAPIPEFAPGISFGVQDVMGETVEGRRYYAAITYRPIVTGAAGDMPADVTLGMIQGERLVPFVGVVLPVAHKVRLLAEHNGVQPAAGIEIRPAPSIGFRMQFRESQNLASVQYTFKF